MKTFDTDNLRRLAAAKPVVSFDVFDTLLVRISSDPLAAFYLVEKVHGFRGFVNLRKSAETEARRLAREQDREDATLDEIYSVLVEMGGVAYAEAQAVECDAERSLLRPNPELAGICRELKLTGKRILAISDMYHDRSFIAELLSREKLPIDEIYVSSETGRLKNTGGMFSHVLENEGIAPADLLHIGDNWAADVRAARKVGITALLYPKIRVQAAASPLIPKEFQAPQPDRGYESICAGLAATRWLNTGKPTSKRDLHWWAGYTLLGPLSRLFVEWLYRQALTHGVEHLFFLRRDGELWQQMFQELHPEIGSEIIYGNRKLLQDADLEHLLERETFPTDHAISFRISHGDSIGAIAKDLDFSPELIIAISRELVDNGKWETTPLNERGSLFLQFIKKCPETWLSYARHRRETIQTYYHRLGVTAERQEKIALVDIGWRLSSFRALESILGFEPRGYFLGISAGAYFRPNLLGFLFDYGAPAEAYSLFQPHFVEVLETLFGGTEPTALAVTEDQNILLDHRDDSEQTRIELTRKMYEGAMQFSRDLASSGKVISVMLEQELADSARTLVDKLANDPDPMLFEAISSLKFSAYAGKSHTTRKTLGETWRLVIDEGRSGRTTAYKEAKSLPLPLLGSWCLENCRSMLPARLFQLLSTYRVKRMARLIEKSGLLEGQWYFNEYPESARAGISAAEHYVRYGVFHGYNPSRSFDSFGYLRKHPDVAREGINPLLHYILHGQHELRDQQ